MRAYVLNGYGGPERSSLTERPRPSPGRGDLLVKVHAAGLNPVDFKTRQGALKMVLKLSLPITLGNEFAGEVVQTGEGASRFKVGDHVFARVEKGRLGAFADYALINERNAAAAPTSIDLPTAAAVPLAALTALQALRDELKVGPGTKVFISGGAGGVGTFAIQLAKWLGADVTTTASPRGDALVRSLGADSIIDYTSRDIATLPRIYDCGFDLVGGETLDKMFSIVKPGGSIVTVTGTPEPQMAMKDLGGRRGLALLLWLISYRIRARARRAGVSYRFLFMHPSGADLATLADLIDQGRLKVTVDRTFPFNDIPAALAYLESGRAKGKVVVQMT